MSVAAAALAVAGAGWGIATMTRSAGVVAVNSSENPIATNEELALAMTRSGLDPTTLSAAGVSAQGVPAVVTAARESLDEGIEQYRANRIERDRAKREVDRLERLRETGQASGEEMAALVAARSELHQAEAMLKSLEDGLVSAAFPQGGSALAVIETIKTQAGQWELPTQYLVLAQSEEDRIRLRNALAHVRIAEQLGQPISVSARTLISECNADPGVVAAAQGLGNVRFVEDAWKTAVYRQ